MNLYRLAAIYGQPKARLHFSYTSYTINQQKLCALTVRYGAHKEYIS